MVFRIGRRALVAGAAAGMAAPARAQLELAEPPCGPVKGTGGRGIKVFLGIPYAAPPVGALRYASPRPHPIWTEPRNATRPGAAAIQTLAGAAAWL